MLTVAGACSPSPDTSPGADLFAQATIEELPGCGTCHTVTDRAAVGGPSLVGIGRVAANRIDDVAAEDYLRASILAPTDYIAPGWGEGMPSYAGVLSENEVETIVDYLRSLR